MQQYTIYNKQLASTPAYVLIRVTHLPNHRLLGSTRATDPDARVD